MDLKDQDDAFFPHFLFYLEAHEGMRTTEQQEIVLIWGSSPQVVLKTAVVSVSRNSLPFDPPDP